MLGRTPKKQTRQEAKQSIWRVGPRENIIAVLNPALVVPHSQSPTSSETTKTSSSETSMSSMTHQSSSGIRYEDPNSMDEYLSDEPINRDEFPCPQSPSIISIRSESSGLYHGPTGFPPITKSCATQTGIQHNPASQTCNPVIKYICFIYDMTE